MVFAFLLALTASVHGAVRADSITWVIDTVHSEVSFRVRHFVSKVPGSFSSWSGVIVADPNDLKNGSVQVRIQTASITTRNDRRDNHLRTSDFFAADSFPEIAFKSRSVDVKGSAIAIHGDLTLRGVTKSITLTGEFGGVMGPPNPKQQRIGFSASTTINRLDYGVKWNRGLEGGGMVLGDEVEISINVEAIRVN